MQKTKTSYGYILNDLTTFIWVTPIYDLTRFYQENLVDKNISKDFIYQDIPIFLSTKYPNHIFFTK